MSTHSFEVELKTINCYTCGIIFSIPVAFHDNRHEDGKTFKCPNDHELSFPGRGCSKNDMRDKIADLEKETAALRSKNCQYLSQIDRFETVLNSREVAAENAPVETVIEETEKDL